MIAEEVVGVDVDSADLTRHPQLDDAVVMARHALPPSFPAIHPLTVVGVFVREVDSPSWFQQIFLSGKELVSSIQGHTTNSVCGQIHQPCECRRLQIERSFHLSPVGAVYDRAYFASGGQKRA